jgi:hypothetical protein
VTALDVAFEKHVRALVAKGGPSESRVIGFASTGGFETGYWIVDLGKKHVRRGIATDKPDVVVEADAATLMLMFGGAIDVARAIDAGVIVVRGDRTALFALSDAIGR